MKDAPEIQHKHNGEGDHEVEDSGGNGEVEWGLVKGLPMEGHTAPGRLVQIFPS